MTTEKRNGFLLGLASKGFLKSGGGGTFVTAKLLKPQKCKIILSVTKTNQ